MKWEVVIGICTIITTLLASMVFLKVSVVVGRVLQRLEDLETRVDKAEERCDKLHPAPIVRAMQGAD